MLSQLNKHELALNHAMSAVILLQEMMLRRKLDPASAQEDDLDDVVGSDVLMIMISMVIMCAYVSIFLSRQRDALHWRAGLAGTAVLSVVLATIAAFGLAAALGIEYNDNVNLAVFVILGVGIDDAFVIVGALDDIATDTSEAEESASTVVNTVATARTNATERVAERVGRALGSCGSTILLSSLTNTIAFVDRTVRGTVKYRNTQYGIRPLPFLGGSLAPFAARIFSESAEQIGGGPRQRQVAIWRRVRSEISTFPCPHGPVAAATSDRTAIRPALLQRSASCAPRAHHFCHRLRLRPKQW